MNTSSAEEFKSATDKAFGGANIQLNSTTQLDAMKYKQGFKEEFDNEDEDKTSSKKLKKSAKDQFKNDLQTDPDFIEFKKRSKYKVNNSERTFGTPNATIDDPYIDKKKYSRPGKSEAKEATGSGSSGAFSGPIAFKDSEFVRRSFAETPKPQNESEYLESAEIIDEGENKPTNPSLWSRAKSMAKSKFKVYPSAYANGWAAKWYKSKGGGWKKKAKNESENLDETMNEDLRRWFKEKWVDVSKKVDGKHPPCGRKDADGKSYPKCRPSKKVSSETPKVASSYSKDEKKNMTQQKRRAEKKEPKIGKGNKPTMTHYDETRKIDMSNRIITNEQSEKIEATEATGSGSVGGYSTPSMWAKSTKKKDWGPSRKTQIPGGGFVKIKKKCAKFPYCNQGDINALKITKNEAVAEAIKEVAKKMNISENLIKTILEHEYQKINKRTK